MDSPLLKYSAKDYFFKAALCHFCIDMLNAKVSPGPGARPELTPPPHTQGDCPWSTASVTRPSHLFPLRRVSPSLASGPWHSAFEQEMLVSIPDFARSVPAALEFPTRDLLSARLFLLWEHFLSPYRTP